MFKGNKSKLSFPTSVVVPDSRQVHVLAEEKPAIFRIKKAYEQVTDQLREAIIRGDFAIGERLPREIDLAEMLGVSRTTVREALRVLSSESLIRTTKGATGGSFVTKPSLDYISEFMTTQINLLTAIDEVSIAETMEVRELLEIEATRLAAERRTAEQLNHLKHTVPAFPDAGSHEEITALNRSFHLSILEAANNRLMVVSAQPVYAVLQAHSQRHNLSGDDHQEILCDHSKIVDAIEASDSELAAATMREHLVKLRLLTEGTWSQAGLNQR